MFILLSKYVKPVEEIDRELENHIKYLDKYYSLGKFVCSGRRNLRIGGVILCNSENEEESSPEGGGSPSYFVSITMLNLSGFNIGNLPLLFLTKAHERKQ